MFNKFILLLMAILLLSCSVSLFADDTVLEFPAPQYMLPMYDHFSVNYLNVEALGRGFTTNAMLGGVENAVNNPATLAGGKSALYMELAIKPPIREINQDNDQNYTSPIPFGMFGLSGKVYKEIMGAVSYNVPKSVVYDAFSVVIMEGANTVTRYPTYYQHQFTTTLAGAKGNFRFGLNLHHQLHQFKDITVFYAFNRIDKTYYVLRVQPGVLYQWSNYRIGATFMPQVSRKMDIDFREYDTVMPMQITGGLAAEFSNNKLCLDAQWEQFSQMDSKFNDRLTLKAGFEKRIRNTTYRAGLISMPGVYQGAYLLPAKTHTTSADTLNWLNVDRGGEFDATDQLNATIGFSYHFKGGKLTLGVMHDLLGNVPSTQFAMALGFNLETLRGKKFLIFDK